MQSVSVEIQMPLCHLDSNKTASKTSNMPLPSMVGALTGPASRFSSLPPTSPDPILHLASLARADPTSAKLDLSIGAYTTTSKCGAVTYTPGSVASASKIVAEKPHPYLPIDGHRPLSIEASKLMFGNVLDLAEKASVSVTAVGGSGALRVALEFWRETCRMCGRDIGRVWVAEPTWPGHWGIPQGAGWRKHEICKYEVDDICNALEKYSRMGDVVILQGGAQNPTGKVFPREEWERVLEVIKRKGLGVVWDVAYQGWGGEGLDGDVWAVRRSVELNMEAIVCQSFSKSMGLYGERVGVLHVVLNDRLAEENVRSLLKSLIRNLHSSPPAFGAKVAAMVLSDKNLRRQWEAELAEMVMRVESTRQELVRRFKEQFHNDCSWSFLADQRGMFAYLNLKTEEVNHLRLKYHIYLSGKGRLSLASLPMDKIDYFVDAVFKSLSREKIT